MAGTHFCNRSFHNCLWPLEAAPLDSHFSAYRGLSSHDHFMPDCWIRHWGCRRWQCMALCGRSAATGVRSFIMVSEVHMATHMNGGGTLAAQAKGISVRAIHSLVTTQSRQMYWTTHGQVGGCLQCQWANTCPSRYPGWLTSSGACRRTPGRPIVA
jgi:hypothetical protein